MSGFMQERVLDVRHWTDELFSFSTTRNPSFRFQNGQFTMIGLEVEVTMENTFSHPEGGREAG